MTDAHLNTLDLNLLRLFDTLMEERNVTRAGVRLGLTQSAVSHALNRLRFALKDELFVRAPEGMRPTPWAAEAAPKIRAALSQIQDALAATAFDPATARRRFAVAASPYVAAVIAPALVARFRREAPLAELSLRPIGDKVAEALDTGRVDLAIAGFGRVADRFEREVLFRDRLVWVIRRNHPAAAEPLTAERLAGLARLVISIAGEPEGDYVSEGGLERRVVWREGDGLDVSAADAGPLYTTLDVPSALAAVRVSDLAALAPMRLAERAAEDGALVLLEPPTPSAPAELVAVSRRDRGARPHMTWFRALLREASAGL